MSLFGANHALIIVDVQNDFLPGGALGVAGGSAIIAPINRLAAQPFGVVVASQDWHPADHCSFDAQGGPWPSHCEAGSQGAALASSLDQRSIGHILRKGMHQKCDSYSAFFDNDHIHSTGLDGLLRSLKIAHLVITGLALDYCVAHTARDARKLGFDVSIVMDATRAIAQDITKVCTELSNLGVHLLQEKTVISSEDSKR